MKRIFVVAVAITASVVAAAGVPKDDQAIIHVLNRIGFGPRPGDVEKVRAIGLRRYIDEQLRPERLADASMTARLGGLTTIGLSAREIAQRYERPAMEARRERRQNAKDAGTDGVALVLGQQEPVAAFPRVDVEMVEPEIGEHFLQLALAVNRAK